MKELAIDCKGINEVMAGNRNMTVVLDDVDMSFLEDVPTNEIIKWHDNQKLLDAMDVDELVEWVLKNVEIKNLIATELGMV